jgi:hypothetical protein
VLGFAARAWIKSSLGRVTIGFANDVVGQPHPHGTIVKQNIALHGTLVRRSTVALAGSRFDDETAAEIRDSRHGIVPGTWYPLRKSTKEPRA